MTTQSGAGDNPEVQRLAAEVKRLAREWRNGSSAKYPMLAAHEFYEAVDRLASLAQRNEQRAGWQSIEMLPPRGREVILVALSWEKHGEDEGGNPIKTDGVMVTEGEYITRHGECGGYFMAFASPVGDFEGVTHWMPLPAAPTQTGEPT